MSTDWTPPRTIDDVLADLDRIVDRSLDEPSRLGYFAALYRKVTQKVKEGIQDGFFDDGHRMERLDVVFANRSATDPPSGENSEGRSPRTRYHPEAVRMTRAETAAAIACISFACRRS